MPERCQKWRSSWSLEDLRAPSGGCITLAKLIATFGYPWFCRIVEGGGLLNCLEQTIKGDILLIFDARWSPVTFTFTEPTQRLLARKLPKKPNLGDHCWTVLLVGRFGLLGCFSKKYAKNVHVDSDMDWKIQKIRKDIAKTIFSSSFLDFKTHTISQS